MADWLEDSLARIYKPFVKLPMTTQITDSIAAEANAFLMEQQSPNNAVAQKIDTYSIDTRSGNTPDSLAAGVFAIAVRVRTLPTLDVIVIQAEIGESVRIQTT
jgi:phage tail sheath protein FI